MHNKLLAPVPTSTNRLHAIM